MISAIRALLQFTTTLPLGKTAPFEAFVSNSWIYPLAGYLIGGLSALIIIIVPASPYVLAIIAIGSVIILSGANHLDGLLDFGDGLMAHGSREIRIHALTDRQTGSGALVFGIIILLLSIMALGSIQSTIYMASSLIIAEVLSKWAMEFLTITGKPFHEGLHAILHKEAKIWFLIPASLLILPVFLLPIPLPTIIVAPIITIIITLIIRIIAYRSFGGVNGDVTGATGEICRAAILATISSLLI